MASTAPLTSETVIKELNPSVTTFSVPFVRSGAEVGVRMSAIKTADGSLVLYNPTVLDTETKSKLDSLGTVKYIVTPNLVHHMFAGPYSKAYPEARFIGAEGMTDKKKDVPIHYAVEMKDASANYKQEIGWGSDIDYAYFPDFAQKEIMLFHRPTKTLFIADMLWNLPANEAYQRANDKSRQPVNHGSFSLQHAVDSHLHPDGWLGKALNWIADKPTDQFKAGIRKVMQEWQPQTIVMEHGDVITTGAAEKLKSSYSWVKL